MVDKIKKIMDINLNIIRDINNEPNNSLKHRKNYLLLSKVINEVLSNSNQTSGPSTPSM